MKSLFQVFSIDLLSRAILGIVSILLIRYMPPSEYGAYIFALSLSMIVAQALASSFNRIYIVGYETLNLCQSPSSFLGFQLLTIAAVVLLSLPFHAIIGSLHWLIVVLIFATCLSEFSKTDFQQELKFIPSSLIELLRSSFFLGVVLTLIFILHLELSSHYVLLIQSSVMLVIFLIASKSRISVSGLFGITRGCRTASAVLIGKYRLLFVYFLIMAFYSQSDIFMLRLLGDNLALPTYGSSFRYYTFLLLALGSIHTVLLPTMQRTMMVSDLSVLLRRINGLLFIFIPGVVLCAWFSKWVIPWIDNGKYPDAVLTFQILSFSAIISFASSPYVNVILHFEDFRYLVTITLIGLSLCILADTALIPIMGAPGAAVATLISFGSINISVFFRARNRLASASSKNV